jgi:hypothetical protein
MFQKYNNDALHFAKKNNLIGVAGSDAHFAREIGNAGVFIRKGNIRNTIISGDLCPFGKKSSLTNWLQLIDKNMARSIPFQIHTNRLNKIFYKISVLIRNLTTIIL